MSKFADAVPEAVAKTDRLLEIVRELALELHPRRKLTLRVALDSNLDHDLGFDSLSRAELLLRLESAFDLQISEEFLVEADTPRDLLKAILAQSASAPARPRTVPPAPAFTPAEEAPIEIATITGVLDWHLRKHPDRPHVMLSEGTGEDRAITYLDLAKDAHAVARGLRRWGLEPDQRVAIMLPNGADFFSAYFGILYAGGVPVPIYPPMRLAQIEDHLRRQALILNDAGAVLLITVPEARAVATALNSYVDGLRSVETLEGLRAPDDASPMARPRPTQIALLQYTSGSTGDPRGVILSHTNLLANIRAMCRAMKANSSDIFVSWLPLYHDMGLTGAWLGSLYFAVPTVIMSPLTFLSRPASWLWAIHRYRGTLSAVPNFAFERCLHSIVDEDIEGLDLSSLRMVVNGAEPVIPATIRRFSERFAKFGFRPEAMAPAYGLAECTVGLAFPPPGRLPIIDRIQREPLTNRGEAVPAAAEDGTALEFVACGQPLPGHQMRVVDATGHEVGERRHGRLQFRGPSATSGYFRNPAASRELFDGEWLETGDLAYVAEGDVFLTGRVKDLVIRAGRNIYPQEVETAVADIEGIRKGCVVVFGCLEQETGTERIVVLAETRESDPAVLRGLRQRIFDVATEIVEFPPDEVVLAPPHTVLKTSSGKLRRAATRELYETGAIGAAPRAKWMRLADWLLRDVLSRLQAVSRVALGVLYAAYWWAVFVVLAAGTWPLVVLLPLPAWRWRVFRGAALLLLRLTGATLEVDGIQHLPPLGGVVVSNHASYLDAVALAAALPGELTFVAKTELAKRWLASPFLRRLGTIFAHRSDPRQGIEDTRISLAAALSGRRLVFFPEGTFTRMPGLMGFRLGAFLVAAQAGVPVIPVIIRGTRSALRGDFWFPRRAALRVSVAPPLMPDSRDWAVAIRLRDAAREQILDRCGEPDLIQENVSYWTESRSRIP